MEAYIEEIVFSMYRYINESDFSYLTRKEINDATTLVTNCGVNSDILFSLLKNRDFDEKAIEYYNKINKISFDRSLIYKIFNVWGHSHVAIFFFLDDTWIFAESSENSKTLFFRHFTETELITFLMSRQNISDWQEICVFPSKISKVNIMLNKLNWIEKYNSRTGCI